MLKKPRMIMIAGANGVGKSTLYDAVIKNIIKVPFINADIIQKDELQDQTMEGSYAAAKVAEQRRNEYLASKKSFVTESTFSHPSKLDLIIKAQELGFNIHLYHVSVQSPDLCVKRVENRVLLGGHNVPEDKIRSRYERNQQVIRAAALKSDYTAVFDNSALKQAPTLLLTMKNGFVNHINKKMKSWAYDLYKNEIEFK